MQYNEDIKFLLVLPLFFLFITLCVYQSFNSTQYNYNWNHIDDVLNVNHDNIFSFIKHTKLILNNVTSNIDHQYSHISNYTINNTSFTQSNVSSNTVVNNNNENHSYQSFSNSQSNNNIQQSNNNIQQSNNNIQQSNTHIQQSNTHIQQSNNNIQQSNKPFITSLYQANAHIQQFTIIPKHQLSNSKSSYNVVLRTKNINDTIIQYSLLKSHRFVKDESYIVSYIDHEQHPVIETNPCESFSFPYCILQNYDDSDRLPFTFSIFFQSDYVIYIDIDQLDIPMDSIDSTLLDSALYGLSKDEFDIFTCTTYSDRILNGCIITKQSLIRQVLTFTTISKGSIEVLDYIPLLFKEMNKKLRVRSLYIKSEPSSYLNTKDKLIPSLFDCNDLTENDTSFTVSVTTYRRPKMEQVFKGFDLQKLQPKQVIMIQNTDMLHWDASLFANRKTKYYHIWCSNWNTKYIGKYLPAIIFDTIFNFIIDDDVFITDSQAFNKVIDKIRDNNSLFGGLGYKVPYPNGKTIYGSLCDHIGFVIYPRIKHLKILFQYKLFMYSYFEDAQISLFNYIKCKFPSYEYKISLTTSTNDGYRSFRPFKKKNVPSYNYVSYPKRESEMKLHPLADVYRFFTDQGYIPVWKRLLK